MTEPEPIGRTSKLIVGGLGLAARIGTQAFTRVRVEGVIDAIPDEGPVILAANHVSNLDGVLIGVLRERGHRPRYVRCSRGSPAMPQVIS